MKVPMGRVQAALRAELEALGFDRDLPLSVDFDAERDITSALICGHAKHEDLLPLEAKHFAGSPYAAIFEITRDTHSITDIAAQLREREFIGKVEEHVEWVADEIPAYSLPALQQRAARLAELWKRRKLRECMGRVDALMAIDELDAGAAIKQLRKAVGEVRA